MSDPSVQVKLDSIFNAHMNAELAGDLDQTLATMAPNPHLVNVPTMVGGQGPEGVRTFYPRRVIGQFFPPDVTFETVSRTYSEERLIDELIISFTHTRQIDWMLPGVMPTGKPSGREISSNANSPQHTRAQALECRSPQDRVSP